MSRKSPSQSQRNARSILLRDYMQQVAPIDRLSQDDLRPVLMGLFGEVGSMIGTAKKLHREKKAYAGYQHAVEEEFGDALWYCAGASGLASTTLSLMQQTNTARRLPQVISLIVRSRTFHQLIDELPSLDETLLKLGEAAAALLEINCSDERARALLHSFADRYL